jgi:hypothetical protein
MKREKTQFNKIRNERGKIKPSKFRESLETTLKTNIKLIGKSKRNGQISRYI